MLVREIPSEIPIEIYCELFKKKKKKTSLKKVSCFETPSLETILNRSQLYETEGQTYLRFHPKMFIFFMEVNAH